jgi:hypothetical protein
LAPYKASRAEQVIPNIQTAIISDGSSKSLQNLRIVDFLRRKGNYTASLSGSAASLANWGRGRAPMSDIFTMLPATTWVFMSLIIGVTTLFHRRYNERDLNYGPIILTMLGIFGCFLGIAIGLFHFDTDNIQGSGPSLLNGIKTSFWTSIAGVGCALTIKGR